MPDAAQPFEVLLANVGQSPAEAKACAIGAKVARIFRARLEGTRYIIEACVPLDVEDVRPPPIAPATVPDAESSVTPDELLLEFDPLPAIEPAQAVSCRAPQRRTNVTAVLFRFVFIFSPFVLRQGTIGLSLN